jgi:hypothetical protein
MVWPVTRRPVGAGAVGQGIFAPAEQAGFAGIAAGPLGAIAR